MTHHNGKLAADVVHKEEEDSNAGRLDLRLTHLRDDREQDGEPGLREKVVKHQADQGTRWLQHNQMFETT